MSNPLELNGGYPVYGGRQGVASGTPSGLAAYTATGAVGTVDADTLAVFDALLGNQQVTGTAALPLKVTVTATALPRVTGTATIRLALTAPSTATPRVTGSATVPLTLVAPSTATARITGTSTIPLTFQTTSSAITRVTASAGVTLSFGVTARTGSRNRRVTVLRESSGPRIRVTDRGLD